MAAYEDTEPSFSPTGDRLVFRRNGQGLENRILITDLSGGLVDAGADLGSSRTPKWSPDGEWLIYIRPIAAISDLGSMVLKRIGWPVERGLGAAVDAGWTSFR